MTRSRLPDLRRRSHRREPLRRFVIFCEGKNTEPSYFLALKLACGKALIEVETIAAAGAPMTLAAAATQRAVALGLTRGKRKSLNSFERHDQVWAVFDRDGHDRYDEAVKLCESRGIGVARSNPCFEVWLILHEEDFDKAGNSQFVQSYFKKLRPEYEPSRGKTPNCADLVQRVEQAEKRAEAQLKRREAEGNLYGPPSTTVGELTRLRTH